MNGKELKEIRKNLGFTQTELANFIGRISMRTVQNWEAGMNKIPYYVDKILEQELKNKKTPFIINEKTQDFVLKKDVKQTENKNGVKSGVPYYNIDFSGGWSSEILFSETRPDFYISNPEFNKAEFACNLIGNSISRRIPNRAIIGLRMIEDWQIYFPTNELYGIVMKNDLRTVKLVKRSKEKDGYLVLIPDPLPEYNQTEYEPEEVPMEFVSKFFQVVAWAQFERVAM